MQGTLNIPLLPNASPELLAQVPPVLPEDCVIVSYPRSGNTWVRFLLANLLEDSRFPLSFQQMVERIPAIHQKKQWDTMRSMSPPRFIKSHMPYTPDYKKVIYIIRDGRDVMVSAYHYYYFPIKISFLDFLQMDIWPGPWDEHLQSWLDNAHLLDLLLIRYEDLLEDPFQQLKNIAHFIGLNTDDEKVDRAVRHSSFTALKKMEANNDSRFSGLPGLKFFRSGKSGQWRQYFGPEHKDVFKRQANTLLMRLGYINTTEW